MAAGGSIRPARGEGVVLDVARVVELEQAIAASGTSLAELMARAGAAVADAVRRAFPEPVPVAVLAGSGNNGGDGWVAARVLAEAGYPVTLLSMKAPADLHAEPARTAALAVEEWATGEGAAIGVGDSREDADGAGSVTDDVCGSKVADDARRFLRIISSPSQDEIVRELAQARVIVDALLGTGFSGDTLRAPFDAWVTAANEARQTHGACVIAADAPSGLSAQTGAAATPCVCADETVTMIALKSGLLARGAAAYVGELTLAPLGIDVRADFPQFA